AEKPTRPTVLAPIRRAARTAETTFGELPLALIAMTTSPGFSRLVSCSEKTFSYEVSFAQAVRRAMLSASDVTRIRARPSTIVALERSQAKWVALVALQQLPTTYTFLLLAYRFWVS